PEFESSCTVWEDAQSALAHLIGVADEVEKLAHAIAAEADPTARRKLEERYDRLQHQLHQHGAYNLDHRIERVLQGLGFATASYNQPVGTLSGGQQNRLLLA